MWRWGRVPGACSLVAGEKVRRVSDRRLWPGPSDAGTDATRVESTAVAASPPAVVISSSTNRQEKKALRLKHGVCVCAVCVHHQRSRCCCCGQAQRQLHGCSFCSCNYNLLSILSLLSSLSPLSLSLLLSSSLPLFLSPSPLLFSCSSHSATKSGVSASLSLALATGLSLFSLLASLFLAAVSTVHLACT